MPENLEVVDLAVRLMEIDSTSGQEGAAMEWLARYLADGAWRVTRIPVSDGRFDVLATAGDAPAVTLSTHIDTVPPYIAPRLDGDTIWGRGACDAKGIAASMICAGEMLRAHGNPVALLFVVGEEVTHDGAEAANRMPTTSKVLINGEPTESKLALGTKGAMRFTLRTDGQAAHSAYPHLGRSAISELVKLLAEIDTLRLPSDPQLGETTINIGTISGGVADNVIAPSAEAHLMARLVTPSRELEIVLRAWIGTRAQLDFGITVELARLGTVPGFETCAVAYATDIPKLSMWGKPFLYGPGSIHVAHRDDERVSVAELHAAVDSYVRIATGALERLRSS